MNTTTIVVLVTITWVACVALALHGLNRMGQMRRSMDLLGETADGPIHRPSRADQDFLAGHPDLLVFDLQREEA